LTRRCTDLLPEPRMLVVKAHSRPSGDTSSSEATSYKARTRTRFRL
jgi:hypothetical protein